MEFKSQICTTKEQSERLLKLGLKPETADMEIEICKVDNTISGYISKGYWESEISDAIVKLIPAWSLHRLMKIVADTPLQVGSQIGMYVEDTYNMVIQEIEWLISRGQFNKDYLEDKK